MDPAAAIGLASNIIQFIQYTGNILSKSREIYRAVDGRLGEHTELEVIAKTLQAHVGHISHQADKLGKASNTATQFFQLCDGVRNLSSELVQTVEKLKVDGRDGKRSKWDSFRRALESVWKEEDIADLLRRLDLYRSQVNTSTLLYIQESIEESAKDATDRSLRIEETVNKLKASLDKREEWQMQLIDMARKGLGATMADREFEIFSSSLSIGAEQDRDTFIKRRILEGLRYENMMDRYHGIAEKHERTFEWILRGEEAVCHKEKEWDNFGTWLTESTEPLYWISGKPGSGKSTLMKSLAHDKQVQQHLSVWGGTEPIYTGSFFFWNSGTSMQMSKEGLLQSLLYQVREALLQDIAHIFPERWQHQVYFGYSTSPWTWPELSQAFMRLLSNETRKFFFLIDGLDELSGDCNQLATFLLQCVSTRPNVKLCVSSRPWLVFTDAFHQRPSLQMQDFNSEDIKVYTTDSLTGHVMFRQLESVNPQKTQRLIDEVTEKSSGVFLWVVLVVKSLLDGLRDGDSTEDLQARLLQLPADLAELYQKLLQDLTPEYLEDASRIFQVVRASRHLYNCWMEGKVALKFPSPLFDASGIFAPGLDLLNLSFLGEDIQTALKIKHREMSYQEAAQRGDAMRRRLQSRCKGLLEHEVPVFKDSYQHCRVGYLHRTVRDFVEQGKGRSLLLAKVPGFDPYATLCAVHLLHLKTTAHHDSTDRFGQPARRWTLYLVEFFQVCGGFDVIGQVDYLPFLYALDEMCTENQIPLGLHMNRQLGEWSGEDPEGISYNILKWSYEELGEIHSRFRAAVFFGLTHFVKSRFDHGYSFDSFPDQRRLMEETMNGVDERPNARCMLEVLVDHYHGPHRQKYLDELGIQPDVEAENRPELQKEPKHKLLSAARGVFRRVVQRVRF
jgi:hypothetical protein